MDHARRALERSGIARSRDLERAGVSRTQIRRLVAQGLIERLGRGLYRDPGALPTEGSDLAQAARLAPGGVKAIVFEPTEAPDRGVGVRAKRVPKMTAGRAALVGLMDRYLAGLLDPFVSLLEVHKLLYFMQEAGEPLRLRLPRVAAAQGRHEAARAALEQAERRHLDRWGSLRGMELDRASALVRMGDLEAAVRVLADGLSRGLIFDGVWGNDGHARRDLAPLWSDPRFQALIKPRG
jgi:hypothetical protein